MTTDLETPFVLEAQLCFGLREAYQAVTTAYRGRLAEVGLTYTQYVVLLVLWEHRQVPMGELGRRVHLDSATLSPLLRRLEARGLVERRRDPDDDRRVNVSCTPAGRELYQPVRSVQGRVEEETGMSVAEIRDLRDRLARLTRALARSARQREAAAV